MTDILSPAGRACNEGTDAGERGDMRIAIAKWRRAVRLDSRCVEALLNLATFAEDSKKAVEFARRAVEVAPENPQSHYVLARALLKLGFKLPALRELREFLARVDPTSEECLCLVAAASRTADRLQLEVLIST